MEEMSGKLRYRIESPRPSYFQQGKNFIVLKPFHSIPRGLGDALCTLSLQYYFSWWCFDCRGRLFLKCDDFMPKPCFVATRPR